MKKYFLAIKLRKEKINSINSFFYSFMCASQSEILKLEEKKSLFIYAGGCEMNKKKEPQKTISLNILLVKKIASENRHCFHTKQKQYIKQYKNVINH